MTGTAKTILFVDDDPDQVALAERVLSGAGYRVLTAGSVADALRVIYAEFPDLVITDVMMPNESGYSLCTRLRADPSTRDVPIIVVTVLDDERPALEAGATAFLSKPIDVEALRGRVAEILRPSDSRAALNDALERLRQGRVQDARAGFLEVMRIDPGSPLAKWARYYVGQVDQHDGNHASAIEQFRAILAEDPEFWRAHNRLAMVFETLGDRTTAARHYQRSLKLYPAQPDVEHKLESLLSSE